MGVEKYTVRGRAFWRVDEWLTLADQRLVRFRQRKIPTKEMALALSAKKRAEAKEAVGAAPRGALVKNWT